MMDDTGVRVIKGMPTAAGWKTVQVTVAGRSRDAFESPEGVRYVRAGDGERADLIVHMVSRHFTTPRHVRLRVEQESALARKARRESKLVAEGEKLDDQRRKARKVRRKR